MRRAALPFALMLAGSLVPALAEDAPKAPDPAPAETPAAKPPVAKSPVANSPAPGKPDDGPPVPDTWIFSGLLQGSKESYSGTLVASKDQSQFEMKLGGGATCDGGQLNGEVGLVRLPEITCTDDRQMRALFVPQGGKALKVFGHVGEERFYAEAHLLGTEAPPEPKPSAAPHGPLGLPPIPPGGAPAPAPKAVPNP